jgi:hypothetical protein
LEDGVECGGGRGERRLPGWPETPATTLAAKKATDPVDITARLRRMWR